MSNPKADIDLDAYLPDEAALKASLEGKIEYRAEVDPRLLQRLRSVETTLNGCPAAPTSASADEPSKSEEPPVAKVGVAIPVDAPKAPAQPSTRRAQRVRSMRAALVAVGAAIAFALVMWRTRREPVPVVEASPPPPLRVLTPDPAGEARPAPVAAVKDPRTATQAPRASSSAVRARPPKPEPRVPEAATRPTATNPSPPPAKPEAID